MNYPKNRYTGPKPWMDYNWLYEEYVVKDRSSQDIANEYHCKQNTIQCWLLKHHIKKDLTKQYHKYEFLYEHYIVQHKTKEIIAREVGVCEDTIAELLRKNNIAIWDYKINNQDPYTKEETEDIINRYVNQKQSSTEIAKIYGVSHRSILNCLKRNGISRRSLSESQFAHNHRINFEVLNDKDLLYYLHWEQNMSCKDIGAMFGFDGGCIRRHMHQLGIKTKNSSEARIGKFTGNKHPNWKGGITPLHLLLREFFHINLATQAAARDNYSCCECGKTHTTLHVHHIYPFAKIMKDIYDSHPELNPEKDEDRQKLYDIAIHDKKFLDIDNLQTLCPSCHYKKHSKTISSQADMKQ